MNYQQWYAKYKEDLIEAFQSENKRGFAAFVSDAFNEYKQSELENM